jgi:hypothetical protein
MIRQSFNIEHYWRVIVYYNVDYALFGAIEKDLRDIGVKDGQIWKMHDTLYSGKAKAVTLSNIKEHVSIVLLNEHKDKVDFVNSIIHEAEHVKQAMLSVYNVEDTGEPSAYTIGYLISQMYQVFRHLICDCGYS